MHYLIWIPDNGESATKQQVFERVGLADHVDNAEAMQSAGPTGKPGTLFCWRRGGYGEFKFDPTLQDWIPAAARDEFPQGRYWVGMWKNDPPLTGQLALPYIRTGKVIQLGGQTWTIPRARDLEETVKLMDDGSVRFIPLRQYQAYYAKACEIAALMEAGQGMLHADAFWFCVQTLRINYRMTPEVAYHMELFTKPLIEKLVGLVVEARDG